MTDLSLPLTSLTAFVNGAILLVLTVRVVVMRRRDGIVLGDNDDRVMTKAIRGQANAAEQIPMGLILIGLIELQGGGTMVLAALAVMFSIGRLMHAIYFAVHGTTWRLRFYGMLLTLLAQGGLLLTLLVTVLR
jgi:uncharacterized membrane protein YecN with MAPEG domain